MRRQLAALILLGLLAGCSRPASTPPPVESTPAQANPMEKAPAAPAPQTAAPAPTAGIIRTAEGWEAPGLRQYMWSPDLKWIAADLVSGLWTISADGATAHLLTDGKTEREIVGWWQGALIYLEHQPDSLTVAAAQPGEQARVVARLPKPTTPQNPVVQFYTIYQDAVILFPPGQVPVKISLRDGAAQSLATEPLPRRCLHAAFSPSGRFGLLGNSCDPGHLHLIDLEQWTGRQVSDELYTNAAWSPVEDTWVALAGAHLDLGNAQGQISHQPLPQPHKLNGGPFWFINGQQLAVSAEVQPATDPRGYGFVNEVWLFTPATATWRLLATNLGMTLLLGWHPTGQYLVLQQIVSSAAPPNKGKLDTSTGQIAWLNMPPLEQLDPTQLDEELLIATGRGDAPRATAFLPAPSSGPPIAVHPAQWTWKDSLQFRPPYVSWQEYRPEGPPWLVVVRR